MATPPLLVLWHSRTGASAALSAAAAEGAGNGGLRVRCEDARAEHFLSAKGYLFCCPENLASMSGAMKEMFDRVYYPLLGRIEGRAYATIVSAGSDGSGAERQIDRIATGWRLRRVAPGTIVNLSAQTPEEIAAPKIVPRPELEAAAELGAALAEGLRSGVF